MSAVTEEQLADLVGDLGVVCELRPCRGKEIPAVAMIHIHHHCPVKNAKQIYAADASCTERCTASAPLCAFCGEEIEIIDVVPL